MLKFQALGRKDDLKFAFFHVFPLKVAVWQLCLPFFNRNFEIFQPLYCNYDPNACILSAIFQEALRESRGDVSRGTDKHKVTSIGRRPQTVAAADGKLHTMPNQIRPKGSVVTHAYLWHVQFK